MGHRKKKKITVQTISITGSGSFSSIWLRDPSAFLGEEPGIDLRDPVRSFVLDEIGQEPGMYVNGPEGQFNFVNPLDGASINYIDPEPPMKPKTYLQKLKDFIMAFTTDQFYKQVYTQAIDTMYKDWKYKQRLLDREEMDAMRKQYEQADKERAQRQEEEREKERKRKEALELKGVYRDRLKALTDENIALKHELEQLKKKDAHLPHK